MRKTGTIVALLMALGIAGVSTASAQIAFGPRVAYGTDFDFAIGGTATYGTDKVLFEGSGPLSFMLALDYYLDCSNCTYFEIAPTAFVPFGPLHAGAGLMYARISADVDTVFGNIDASSSDIGLAIHGGYTLDIGSQRGVLDARFGLGASEQLVVSFTYLFGGGGGDDM